MAYTTLSRAQLSFEYLHTNSTTHEFLFGALAELLDNARDASATKINIYTDRDKALRGGYMVCFLDDGEGMDPSETADIITFGKSSKRSLDNHQIGMYGNGLKSGSMRIGNDLILFTKKGLTMSCLFLSRTFHEEENIDEVIVPLPSFEASTRRSLAKGTRAQEKHDVEMNLIYKYSPFRSEEEFFAQFDKIEGNSGTLVIIFNLKLLDSGETELDINTDPCDILLTNPASDFDSDEGLVPEKRSFRAYAAILYVDPRMRIYIQNKKVRTKRLACCLYKPRMYRYSSNRFKARSETEVKKAQEEAIAAENKAREAESKAKNMETKIGNSTNRDLRAELRKLQNQAAEYRCDAQMKKQLSERKSRCLKDPKTLNLIFGINLESRNHDGVFVYNCSRLIKMYEKVGPQTEGGVNCSGVVGIVDVPYLVLEPTHNKQDFADAKEYRHLIKAMGEHMVQYWKDVGIMQQGVTKFWENFGYISSQWKDSPSQDIKYVRKRSMQINVTLQCDMCLKWRTLPFSSSHIGKDFPDDWVCAMNPEQQHNKCSAAEQKMNLSEGFLKKEGKTPEQKKKELEEEIKKQQEKLEKIEKSKPVTSSKQLRDMEKEKRRQEEEKEKERKRELEEREKERINQQRIQRQIANLARPLNNIKKTPEPSSKPKTNSTSTAATSTPRSRQPVVSPKRETPKPVAKVPAPVRTGARTVASVKAAKAAEMAARSAAAAKLAASKPSPAKETEVKVKVVKPEPKKRRAVSTVDSEPEEPSPPPAKKGRPAAQKVVENNVENEEDEMSNHTTSVPTPASVAATVPTPASTQTPISMKKVSFDENEADASSIENDNSMDGEDDAVIVKDADSNGDIGQRVEALIGNKWYPGVIVKVNTVEAKWKVKFDNNTKDKYDKWFDKQGSDIRMLKTGQAQVDSSSFGPQSPASISSHDTAAEAPTSSTATPASSQHSQITEEIANGYRTCLRYFLPPQWIMDKESISSMSNSELAAFPLDDFFDHYEKGLRRLVSNFQNEAAGRKQEAEEAKSKLASVRKLIAKLLKSINEDFDLDPEGCGDQVDELLEACVRQAEQQSQS